MNTDVFTRILTKSRRKYAVKNRLGFGSLYPIVLSLFADEKTLAIFPTFCIMNIIVDYDN